jgi:hypothetical protein
MFADDDGMRPFVSEKPKNLRAFAIEALAKVHARRDWLLPPVVFHVSILFNVAHGLANFVILSEAKNLRLFSVTTSDGKRK